MANEKNNSNSNSNPSAGNAVVFASDGKDDRDPSPLIGNIYKSMSQIIEAINSDNMMLNEQIRALHNEMEFLMHGLASVKVETQEISSLVNTSTNELDSIKQRMQSIGEMQKNLNDTRNLMLQSLDLNIRNIKRELNELHSYKSGLRNLVKTIMQEEISKMGLNAAARPHSS
jgi:DNA repair ATPase RecN